MTDRGYMALKAELEGIKASYAGDLGRLRESYSARFARMDEIRAAMERRADENVEGLEREELWNIYEADGDYDGTYLILSMAATDAGDFDAVRNDERTLLAHLDPHDYDRMRDGLYAEGMDDPLIGAYYVIGWDGRGHAFLKNGPMTAAEAAKVGKALIERGGRDG